MIGDVIFAAAAEAIISNVVTNLGANPEYKSLRDRIKGVPTITRAFAQCLQLAYEEFETKFYELTSSYLDKQYFSNYVVRLELAKLLIPGEEPDINRLNLEWQKQFSENKVNIMKELNEFVLILESFIKRESIFLPFVNARNLDDIAKNIRKIEKTKSFSPAKIPVKKTSRFREVFLGPFRLRVNTMNNIIYRTDFRNKVRKFEDAIIILILVNMFLLSILVQSDRISLTDSYKIFISFLPILLILFWKRWNFFSHSNFGEMNPEQIAKIESSLMTEAIFDKSYRIAHNCVNDVYKRHNPDNEWYGLKSLSYEMDKEFIFSFNSICQNTLYLIRELLKEHFKSQGIDLEEDISITTQLIMSSQKVLELVYKDAYQIDEKEKRKILKIAQWVVTLSSDPYTYTYFNKRDINYVYDPHRETAFNHIIFTGKPFSCNDLRGLAGNYINSNPRWPEYYNSILMVPIEVTGSLNDDKIYLGFITVTSLNENSLDLYNDKGVYLILRHYSEILALSILSLIPT